MPKQCSSEVCESHEDFKKRANEYEFKKKISKIAEVHLASIKVNAFMTSNEIEIEGIGGFREQHYIYDFLSGINHSCDPNLDTYLLADVTMRYITLKNIKKGEQLFIRYLGEKHNMELDERQKRIKKNWFFECHCSLCTSQRQ